jgi:hypothetical protein
MPQRIAQPATWPNSAAATTEVTVTGTQEEHRGSGAAVVLVHNPNTVTALTVTPRVRMTDRNGTQRLAALPDVPAFSVPANSTEARRIPSLVGIPDLSLKNATALGAGDGFTAEVIIQYESA